VKVRVIYSLWGADGFDEPLSGGEHDLGDLTEEQARSVAGAEAGGVLEVLDATKAERALLAPHVQSQEDGEAALAAATESGEWQEGNLAQFEHEVAAGVRAATLEEPVEVPADETEVAS
jgi:hypothetical protein